LKPKANRTRLRGGERRVPGHPIGGATQGGKMGKMALPLAEKKLAPQPGWESEKGR